MPRWGPACLFGLPVCVACAPSCVCCRHVSRAPAGAYLPVCCCKTKCFPRRLSCLAAQPQLLPGPLPFPASTACQPSAVAHLTCAHPLPAVRLTTTRFGPAATLHLLLRTNNLLLTALPPSNVYPCFHLLKFPLLPPSTLHPDAGVHAAACGGGGRARPAPGCLGGGAQRGAGPG